MRFTDEIMYSAKALLAAVLAAIVTWLNTEYSVEWWAQLLVVIVGAVIVWLVPNKEDPVDG